MPKAQNHKGYSCRVNILKYVKVADEWRFAPAQTQNNKLKQDWVLVDGSPERHAEGTYYVSRKELPMLQQAEIVQKDLIAVQPYASYPLLNLMAGTGGEELFYSAFRYLNFWNSKQIPKESGLRHQGSYIVDRYPFALTCTAGVIPPGGRYLQLEHAPKAVSLGFAENLLNSYKTLLDEITQAVK